MARSQVKTVNREKRLSRQNGKTIAKAPDAELSQGRHPIVPTLETSAFNLREQAEAQLLKMLASDASTRDRIRVQMQELREALGWSKAPALERLLMDQIALTWLGLYWCQFAYANATVKDRAIAHADYWERRMTAFQRRHLRAIETLAKIRKLGIANAVQINISQNQMNTAG